MNQKTTKHAFQRSTFLTFDEAQDFIDNLGYDYMLINKFDHVEVSSFLRKTISKETYSQIDYQYKKYLIPESVHEYKSIVGRSREMRYKTSVEELKKDGIDRSMSVILDRILNNEDHSKEVPILWPQSQNKKDGSTLKYAGTILKYTSNMCAYDFKQAGIPIGNNGNLMYHILYDFYFLGY